MFANVVTFAPVVAIGDQGPFIAGPRSILKPTSFPELSVQTRSISLEDTALVDRELGSAGGVPAAAVGVRVGVVVGVRVGVDVAGPGVGVRDGVAVGKTAVGVRVAVRVGVAVEVGVAVRVGVAVAVGVAESVVADAMFE